MEETDPEIIKINQQILELRRKRDKLLSEETSEIENQIRNLEWTKDCEAELEISNSSLVTRKYKIILVGNVPEIHTYVVVMGDSKVLKNNIVYALDSIKGRYCLSTDNEDLLAKFLFLSTVKFKSFNFDEVTLEILLACRKLKNRMEYPHMTGGQG